METTKSTFWTKHISTKIQLNIGNKNKLLLFVWLQKHTYVAFLSCDILYNTIDFTFVIQIRFNLKILLWMFILFARLKQANVTFLLLDISPYNFMFSLCNMNYCQAKSFTKLFYIQLHILWIKFVRCFLNTNMVCIKY